MSTKDSGNKEEKAASSNKEINIAKWLLIFGTLLAGYSHIFGYSYLRGKISAIGFHNIQIDLSIPETLYQATEGLSVITLQVLHKISVSSVFFHSWHIFIVAPMIAIPGLYIWENHIKKPHSIKPSQKSAKLREITTFNTKTSLTFWTIVAIASIFLTQIFFIVALTIGILLLLLGLAFGDLIGKYEGYEVMRNNPCINQSEDRSAKYYDSCTTINIENGRKIQGYRIFSNDDYTYLLTADLAYIVSRDGVIREQSTIEKNRSPE